MTSAKRTMSDIRTLNTGNQDKSDKFYEEKVCRLLATLLYPQLDLAQAQSRTESGCQIRDLVFYNNCSEPIFKEIFDKYGSYQLVFELKNVKEISREHIAQVNRYLNENFGKFGVIVTRNRPLKKYQTAFGRFMVRAKEMHFGNDRCRSSTYGRFIRRQTEKTL